VRFEVRKGGRARKNNVSRKQEAVTVEGIVFPRKTLPLLFLYRGPVRTNGKRNMLGREKTKKQGVVRGGKAPRSGRIPALGDTEQRG